MSKFWTCLFSLSLAALLVSPVLAQDARAKKNKPAARNKELPAVQLPKDITLTDEQKTKVAELEKEYGPKMKELREKLDKTMTDEQKKARQEVLKEAREKGKEGKKGKELHQAINDAMKLTEEQQKKYDETDKQIVALRQEILEKVKPILTDEQKEKLPKRPERNPARNKKAA
jgi:succinate dehydrogenase/fumarate reductase flavoprotein subunit